MFEQVGLKEAERIKTAIHTFDNIYREQTGGQWDVLLSSPLLASSSMYSVRPQQRTQSHSAPIVHLSAKPKDPYASLEWEENIHALFEWTGMACLGSQRSVHIADDSKSMWLSDPTRLEVNDRVDQYVSTYEPPTPSAISHGAHLMWCGFMSPSHVQHILDTLV
jgi:ribonuclease P/MRP protein subunit RPP40